MGTHHSLGLDRLWTIFPWQPINVPVIVLTDGGLLTHQKQGPHIKVSLKIKTDEKKILFKYVNQVGKTKSKTADTKDNTLDKGVLQSQFYLIFWDLHGSQLSK